MFCVQNVRSEWQDVLRQKQNQIIVHYSPYYLYLNHYYLIQIVQLIEFDYEDDVWNWHEDKLVHDWKDYEPFISK